MLAGNKTDRFLDRLIQDTRSGKIVWHRASPPDLPRSGSEEYAGAIYLTTIKSQTFRLCPLRYRNYTDEVSFVWIDTVVLELIDNHDLVVWQFPESPQIPQLLETVQYASSGIEQIIDDVLAEG